jgi:hypothetical protein
MHPGQQERRGWSAAMTAIMVNGHHGHRVTQHCQWAVYTLFEPYMMQSRKFPASLSGFPYVFGFCSFPIPFLFGFFPKHSTYFT